MPLHAYNFNAQRIALQHNATYLYLNKDIETANGFALNTAISGATYQPVFDWNPLQNQALEKLTSQTRGDLDLSIDLAEMGKTLKMLKLSEQAVDYTSTFVKRFGPIRAASKAWLTYTYGIKPLLSSIFGIADENLRMVINKTQRYRVRASGFYFPTTVNLNTCLGSVNFPVEGGSKPVKVSVTYGLDLRTEQFDLSRWSSLNPVSIAWELTPLSFVFDWFYNVGGYLRNYETYLISDNKFRSGYRTRLAVGEVKCGISDVGVGAGEISHSSIWKGNIKSTNIERTVLASYPAPTLPSFGVDMGSSRMLSAAALLGTLLGRR
jgi:hypothetical protein